MRQYIGTPYMGADFIWHYPYTDSATGQTGEDLSYEGPQQAAPTNPMSGGSPGNPVVAPQPSTWNPADPTQGRGAGWGSIGAGTQWTAPGWGVPGFGQAAIPIQQQYLDYLKTAPGYIPGSGTYNQFRLDQPGLLTNINGQMVNARYGQGGTGDPTTGQEPRTPDEWLNGPKAFSWEGNMGQTDATRGLDYIANLFGRPDAGSSGISTAAWSAPDAYWQGLAKAVQAGTVKASAFGLKALASKGYNVSPPGGAVDLGGGGAGGPDNSMQGALASIAASQAADQAARLAYQEWVMRTGDETLAQQKAQQAWSQSFQEKQQAFSQEYQTASLTGKYQGQDTLAAQQQAWAKALGEAGLTGQYNGQQTQQAQQQAWNQQFQQQQLGQSGALSLLGLQSQLQGPRDWAKYWQMSASAPEGLKSALGSLAGQYNFAPGAQGTPGAATLQSRTTDLLAPGAGAQGTGQPGQAANPWQFNLQNWSRMNPSMQQGVLGGLEAGGMYGPDVEAMLKAAAPRYTGPAAAQVGMS